MKRRYKIKILLSLIISFSLINTSYAADDLGRLFTTQGERNKLERIRHAKPKPEEIKVVEAEIEEIIEPVETEKEIIIRDAIILKGLVHRSDGKNAAWINDSNTFEGNLESQYIQIKTEEIESDQVQLTMPDNKTKIKIKVGDYYDPQSKDDN
jgi:hypothetical protein